MNWSEEQVIALSPDDSSAKAGKDLAKPEKWVSLQKNERALWGECKGSGSKPYQTQIDLNNIAFKCSCPSRKFPCKHGLGLLLLYARNTSLLKEAEEPAWVSEWLAKRAVREEKKTEKKEAPVDEAAQAKRQQARQLKVGDGIEELLVWVKDMIRNGILNMPDKTSSYWENIAKRMVDAQAPGLARMIHTAGNTNFYTENWQSHFIDQLLRIYLICKGYQNLDHLPAALQEDIKSYIGFTYNQEELKEQQGVTDTWFVLSKQSSDEGNITTERFWLYGDKSKRYALLLQFIVNGQGKTITLTPGMALQAELVYFPSVSPLRALLKRQMASDAKIDLHGYAGWKQVAMEETKINSMLPVAGERPYIVHNIRLVQHEKKWWLADSEGHLALMKEHFRQLYKLLALSGGQPLTLSVLGHENCYEPMGAWVNNNYYTF